MDKLPSSGAAGGQGAKPKPTTDETASFAELWNAVFNTYYDVFYNEVLADKLIGLWQIFDDTSKIVIAAAASGSAIAGWALWNQPKYRPAWSIFAALSAITGVIDTSLGVSHRLKNWGDTKRSFATIRVELETLMYRMRFDTHAATADFQGAFIASRRKYLRATQRLQNDILLRRWLEISAQKAVNLRLERDARGA